MLLEKYIGNGFAELAGLNRRQSANSDRFDHRIIQHHELYASSNLVGY
jgi:hypothetical protein